MKKNRLPLASGLLRSSLLIATLTLLFGIQPISSSITEHTHRPAPDARLHSESSSIAGEMLAAEPTVAEPIIAAAPFAAMLSATKTVTDVNGGNAEPGDTLMYSVTITNSGAMDATNVNFTDTIDANTTLVGGSVNVSPLAGDDAYTTIGNTRLTVGFTSVGGASVAIPGQNIFDNDMDFLGDTFTVTAFQNPSAQGGNVSINSIFGRLDYVPPVGFTGTDTISYTITDTGGKSATATITITVNNVVWYVNSASAAGGDGRSTSPFQTLTPVNGAGGSGDPDAPGHFIYVHTGSGNYTTGIGLENNQNLIGQGVALVVSSLTLNPAGTKPVITNASGNGVTLASGNTVRGLIAQTTTMGGASAGIGGSSVGNFNADTVQAVGNPGAAIDIQTAGTMAVTLESASSTTGAQGLRVTGASGGTFTVSGATTITNAVTTGINLSSNGTAVFNFSGGVTVSTTAGTGILASSSGTVNISSGTVAATGGPAINVNPTTIGMTFSSLTSTSSTTTGISLTSASGSLSIGTTTISNPSGIGINATSNSATLNFGTTTVNDSGNTGVVLGTGGNGNTGTITFGDLDIDPDNNVRCLHAVDNTMTITTTSGTINATGATAVEITRASSTTPLAVSLTSVSANGGSTNGIVLTRTSGSFTVTGNGNTSVGGDNSGGTLQNLTRGVLLNTATNVSFTNVRILNTSDDGIDGTLVTNFTFKNGNIDNSGTGLGVDTSNIGFNTTAAATENNLNGTVTITSNTLTNAFSHGIDIFNFNGTISDANLSTNTITSSTSTATSKGSGIRLVAFGSATTVANVTKATISSNTIQNFPSGAGIVAQGGNANAAGPAGIFGTAGSATDILNITSNTIRGNSPANRMSINAIQSVVNGKGQGNFNVSNNGTAANPITNITGNKIVASAIGNVTVTTTIANNHITANDTAGVGGAFGISAGADSVLPTPPGSGNDVPNFTLTVTGNIISSTDGSGIFIRSVNNVGALNLTVKNNDIGAPLSGFREGIQVHSGSPAATGNTTVCLDISGNTSAGSGGADGIGVRKQGTVANVFTFGIEGLSPSPANVAQTEAYIAAQNPASDGGATVISGNNFVSCSSAPAAISAPLDIAIVATSANPVTDYPATDSSRNKMDTLHAAPGEAPKDDNVQKLSQQELTFMVQAALARWRDTRISAEDMARLEAATFEIADLPTGQIAANAASHIKIDETAAGYGWYFDEGPQEDGEFQVRVPERELQATELSFAHEKMDLLTVVMRELGQVYVQGKDRLPRDIRRNLRPMMEGTLSPGVRRLPLDQWRVTPLPVGSIKPSSNESLIAQSSATAQPQAAQTSSEIISSQARSDKATIPASARYAAFNPSNDAASFAPDLLMSPPAINSNHLIASARFASTRAARVALAPMSGETVMVPAMGPGFTLPAGKSITIMFNVTINNPLPAGVCSVSNQGTVTADGPISITTDGDAGMMGAQPTVTQIVTPPTITCNTGDITSNTDPGLCTATESFTVTATGCPTPTITCTIPGPLTIGTTTSPTLNGSFAFPKGVTTVTCTATSAGGSPTCSFTVTVNDNENPTISCPTDITTGTDSGLCSAVVNYTVPTGADNCPGVMVTCSPATGFAFPKGITTVTCTATDAVGLTAQCSFIVTVNDNENPMLIGCPSNISTNPPAGQCTVTVNYTPPTVSDNCPGVGSVVCVPASGSSFPTGVTSVTCSVVDAVGNTAMCSFTVTVTDDQFPSITCPANMQISTGAGCATVTYTTPTPTDNCPGVMVNCAPASGMCFPVGTTTVTCTATDASNNMTTCMFTIEVVQCTITCPMGVTVNNDAGQCSAVVTYTNPMTTGSCGSVSCSPASGSSFPVGTTTVTCTTSVGPSCSFTVTVNDTQNPTVMCPANIVQGTDAGLCSAIVNYTVPTATDNCPGATVMCSPNTGTSFPTGITTVTCTATDASGNTGQCTFSVTISDDDAPSITCPMPVTQGTDAGQCTAVVNYSAPMVSDNCSGVGTPVCTPPSGSMFPKGVTTVGCSVSDMVGNSASCSFTVTVNDMQTPTITCPSAIVTGNTAGQCSAVVTFAATAMDNCAGVGVMCAPGSGSSFAVGTTSVSCTATDASGNTASCSFTVTVNDTQAPTIVCPPTQVAPPGVVNYPAPVFGDNCAGASVVCNPPSGSSFPAGFTTVTCVATDAAGNSAMCSFLVTTFDQAIVSDSGGGAIFINTVTGDYMVCCGGMIVSGKGTITKKGCVMTLTHNPPDRRLTVTYDTCKKEGKAVLQMPPGTVKCTIIDSDTRNSIVAPCTP